MFAHGMFVFVRVVSSQARKTVTIESNLSLMQIITKHKEIYGNIRLCTSKKLLKHRVGTEFEVVTNTKQIKL